MGGESTTYMASSSAARQPAVALAGRVPVKVTNENGPIKIGDYIRLSSIPGLGMRATTSGEMVGVALEAFETSATSVTLATASSTGTTTREVAEGKIMVFVKPGYQAINIYKSNGAEVNLASDLWSVDYETGTVKPFAALDMAGLDINNVNAIRSQSGKWSLDANGQLTVQKLCLGATCIDETELKTIIQNAGAASVPLLSPGGGAAGGTGSGGSGGSGSSSNTTDQTLGSGSGSGTTTASTTPPVTPPVVETPPADPTPPAPPVVETPPVPPAPTVPDPTPSTPVVETPPAAPDQPAP
jgi:hypothetical protein